MRSHEKETCDFSYKREKFYRNPVGIEETVQLKSFFVSS